MAPTGEDGPAVRRRCALCHVRKTRNVGIDDAHLIDVRDLRRLRLLFEDFTAR